MNGRLIAIGDIHGCRNALDALLEGICPTSEDTIVTLGDYIDRGPDSCGVIERLCRLSEETHLVPLIGNHEQMMLDVLHGDAPYQSWFPHGGVATLDSYEFVGDLDFLPEHHRAFLDSLVDYYETETHFFVHANYDPDLPLEAQRIQMTRWRSLRDGIPDPHQSGKIAVVGHTANHDAQILDLGHLIALDTFCYGGGLLSAIDVLSGEVWQASEEPRAVRRE
jgi:serine/threonine protein phosphatase 1